MLNYLDNWLSRKRERPQLPIRESRSSRFKFTRMLGPRGEFAVVHLSGEPAAAFGFCSLAEWPDATCDCTDAVLEGILDELFAVDFSHVTALVQFTLEKIEWHEVDSCASAFYYAARGAVREILGRDRYSGNVDYRTLMGVRS
jgi:hypothetical protein